MKTLSVRQLATVKRVAQNVAPLVAKKNKINEKIAELQAEYEALNAEINGHEMGIKSLTGYTSEELVVRVVETTDKVDKNGNPVKITKYEPRPHVVYNEETKLYDINEPYQPVSLEEVDDTTEVEMTQVPEGTPSPVDEVSSNFNVEE